MIRSLRSRLRLVIAIGLGVALAAAVLLSSQFLVIALRSFAASDERAKLERLGEVLTDHYRQRGGWVEVEPALARLAAITGRRLALLGPQGEIISFAPPAAGAQAAPHQTRLVEPDAAPQPGGDRGQVRGSQERPGGHDLTNAAHTFLRDARGASIGTLFVFPPGPSAAQEGQVIFVGYANRLLVLAVLLSGMAALAVAFTLSRRILGPVEELTKTARVMEAGDLSQRIRLKFKDEVGELAGAFNAMADSLVRAEHLRRNLVNDVAHELRTPLTNIRCQIEALQDGLTAPGPEAFGSLHEEALLLSRLIDDLQELALAEAGQLSLRRQPVSLAAEVELALRAIRPQAEERDVSFGVDVPAALPPASADPARLRQILGNLLSNALRYTSPGSQVRIRACLAGSMVEVAVEDQGPGIAEEHLSCIFERFYRTDASRARATGGAGLGLAIVKQLVEAQGGRVWATSKPGRGSTFTFTLPLAEP